MSDKAFRLGSAKDQTIVIVPNIGGEKKTNIKKGLEVRKRLKTRN